MYEEKIEQIEKELRRYHSQCSPAQIKTNRAVQAKLKRLLTEREMCTRHHGHWIGVDTAEKTKKHAIEYTKAMKNTQTNTKLLDKMAELTDDSAQLVQEVSEINAFNNTDDILSELDAIFGEDTQQGGGAALEFASSDSLVDKLARLETPTHEKGKGRSVKQVKQKKKEEPGLDLTHEVV